MHFVGLLYITVSHCMVQKT